MTNKKRILAFVSAFVILITCFISSLVPVYAYDQTVGDVTYSIMSYQYQGIDQGAVPYGYYSWAGLFGYYHQNSGNQYFYFELRNTVNGGLSYAPQAGYNNWDLAYSFNQPDYGVGDPLYRFYMPWNNGNGWDFQIITYDLGNVIFDSSGKTFFMDSSNTSRGYYEFTIDRSILGLYTGWYIYSLYVPFIPSVDPNVATVSFNYFDENLNFIETVQRDFYVSSSMVEVTVPDIPNYVIQNVEGPGIYYSSDKKFVFNSLTSSQILTVRVYSFDYILSQQDPAKIIFRYYIRENGVDAYLEDNIQIFVPSNFNQSFVVPFPSGYQSYLYPASVTLSTGLLAPGSTITVDYQVISNNHAASNLYNEGYANGYDVGYRNGFSDGSAGSGSSEPISNPLLFLTEPVVAFLNIQVYPGLSLGVGFLAAIAVCLIVVFLKIFSGG